MRVVFLSQLDFNLYLFRLAVMEELVKEGHEVFAFCPAGDVSYKFSAHGVTHVDYKIVRASLNPFRELATIRNLYKKLKRLKPDILQTFTAKPNIYGAIAGGLAKVPVIIITVTGMGSYYISNSRQAKFIRGIMEILYKEAIKKSDGVIFQNSDDEKYFIENRLVSEAKTHLVRSSGVDTSVFDPDNVDRDKVEAIRNELGLAGKKVILLVGRTIWHKGIKEYAQAAALLKTTYPEAVCLLVGGNYRDNPSCAPKEWLREQNFIWTGWRGDVKELMALSHVVVLPSYREGVPRALLEASAMGKPMVATDAIGCREVVEEGINGFLVPLYDGKTLGEKIGELLVDATAHKAMGEKARKRALKEFDVKIITSRYLDIYRKLLGETIR